MYVTNVSDIKAAARDFGKKIIYQLEKLSLQQTDIVLIYIPKEFELLTSFSDDLENYDLYNFAKAYAALKKIAT